MKVTADQPKQSKARAIFASNDDWSVELVVYSTALGLAYGWRLFSDNQSVVSETLYDDNEEAQFAGYEKFCRAIALTASLKP